MTGVDGRVKILTNALGSLGSGADIITSDATYIDHAIINGHCIRLYSTSSEQQPVGLRLENIVSSRMRNLDVMRIIPS